MHMPQIGEIQVKSRREHIADMLRDAILDGELKPGDALVESDLAGTFKVSRAPLREALQVLTTEGLVEVVPYHGTTVRKLTPKDIEELYSLRSVLETFAIQRLIERADPGNVDQLRQIYVAMHQAALAGDWKRLSAEDQNFHTALIKLTQHELLLTMWNMVYNRVRQVMTLRNQKNRDPLQVAANHMPIIDAIAVGNLSQATMLICKHAASAADLALEDWQYPGDEAEGSR
jgi:DNA-binding GntR family transcriptional regulator